MKTKQSLVTPEQRAKIRLAVTNAKLVEIRRLIDLYKIDLDNRAMDNSLVANNPNQIELFKV